MRQTRDLCLNRPDIAQFSGAVVALFAWQDELREVQPMGHHERGECRNDASSQGVCAERDKAPRT